MVALMLRKSPKICLACSAGGHLRELQLAIGAIPEQWDCYWLTLKTTSTKAFMADKEHVFLVNFQPAKKWTLIVNCLQAIFWVLVKRPDVIITTGAGVTVPTVFFAKKLLGTKVIFVNSAADVTMILVWSPGGIAFREKLGTLSIFKKKEKEVQ